MWIDRVHPQPVPRRALDGAACEEERNPTVNDDDAVADIYEDSDADAVAFGGDERWAQGDTVPPDP